MSNKYRNVVRAVFDQPWLIHPTKMETIAELIELRASGATVAPDDIAMAIGGRRVPDQNAGYGGVAVLSMFGVLSQRMGLLEASSGGTSTEVFGKAFDAALADPSVKHIVLHVDSPGGSSFGVQELSAKIAAARGTKPVTAVIDSMSASGAYWLSTAADTVVVTPGGMVGSIGVFMMHTVTEEMQEKIGVRHQVLRIPEGKAEGTGGAALSEAEVESRMRLISGLYESFVGAVAANRGVSVERVRTGFGQGRMVSAAEALSEGMVDRIATFDDVIAELQGSTSTQPVSARTNMSHDPNPTKDAATEPVVKAADPGEVFAAVKLASALTSEERLDLANELIDSKMTLSDCVKTITTRQSAAQEAIAARAVELGNITPGPSERDKFYSQARQQVIAGMLMGRRPEQVWNFRTEEYETWTPPGRMNYKMQSLLYLAGEALHVAGLPRADLDRMAPERIAKLALGVVSPDSYGLRMASDGPAYNTTGDFANLLLDASNVTLRMSYDDANTTFQTWMKQGPSVPDFKTVNRVIGGELSDPKAIPEDGEFEETTMSDGRETYKLTVWGHVFSISWQSIVNDALSAFAEVPTKMGRAMRRKQNRLAYAVLKDNANMADGVALFNTATHNNNIASGAAPNAAQLNAMTSDMMEQTGLDTDSGYLNLMPSWLIVPPALRGTTLEFLASTANPAAASGNSGVTNIWQNGLSPIVEAELSAAAGGSDVIWYLAADSRDIDTIEYAYLQGLETPVIEQAASFDRLAVRQRCYQAFAVKALDYRGLHRNAGA